MKKYLLSLLSLTAIGSYSQVEIEPFAPLMVGSYLGNFSTIIAGLDIPSNSLYNEEGDLAGPDNLWTSDNGIVAAFPGSIGNWASGRCTNGESITLVSPEMNFGINTTNPTLDFRYIIDNGSGIGFPGAFGNLNMEVMYKESAGGSWNTVGTYTLVDFTWHDISVSLSGASSYATYYLGFRIYGVTAGFIYDWGYMGLDEIVVEGTPNTCTPTSNTFNQTACVSFTSPSGLYTWTTDGAFNDTIPNVEGCDSVITVNLTINSADNNATQTGNSLSADASGATYQWLDCNNAYAIVGGATSQVFNPTVDGSYAVSVTQTGCTDTSTCFAILGLGLKNLDQDEIQLFPNPTNGDIKIILGSDYHNAMIIVYSADGKIIEEYNNNNSSVMPISLNGDCGIYFVTVIIEEQKKVFRVIKN